MKIQFGISSLLLSTALVAIWTGGFIANWKMIQPVTDKDYVDDLLPIFLLSAPVWLPVVSIAYIIGRKAVTVGSVVTLAIAEAVAIGRRIRFF